MLLKYKPNYLYHKFCLFWRYDTGPKHRNKPEIFLLVSRNKTKNNRKQIEFRFVSLQTKKINCFEDTLIESIFRRIFRFVSVYLGKVLFVSVVSIPIENTKTNQKKIFGFREINQNRLSSVCFGSNQKKIDCFELYTKLDMQNYIRVFIL